MDIQSRENHFNHARHVLAKYISYVFALDSDHKFLAQYVSIYSLIFGHFKIKITRP